MTDTIHDLITRVLKREGGYVHHPADRGGPTKYGITQGTLASWRGRPVTAADVQGLTEDEARDIYRSRYFVQPALDCVTDAACLEFLFDYAVNSGPGAAVRALQKAVGVTADGIIGPITRGAVGRVSNWPALFWRLKCERYDLFMRLIGRDHSQAVFATGWANRMDEFRREIG